MKYYGRLRIHPLTADGFAPPYVTEEGWNQGDNPSGDTYQVSGSPPHPDDVRVPPTPSGVPFSNLSYSDDRRLVRPTRSSLVDLTRLCTRATVAKGGLVHMDKLRFFALELDCSVLRLQQTPVPHYLTSTSTDCPQVVGIPLSHALRPPGVYADLAKQIARMRRPLNTNPATTILALRSLWAFILSQLDYVASGVAVPPEHVEERPCRPAHSTAKSSAYSAGRPVPSCPCPPDTEARAARTCPSAQHAAYSSPTPRHPAPATYRHSAMPSTSLRPPSRAVSRSPSGRPPCNWPSKSPSCPTP